MAREEGLSAAARRSGPSQSVDEDRWPCRFCDRVLTSAAATNTHEARVHTQQIAGLREQATEFRPDRDAVPGSLQCAHCGTQFSQTLNLSRRIISLGACRQFNPHRSVVVRPHVARPELQLIIQSQGVEALCADRVLCCKELTSQCCVCDRKLAHAWRISHYIQASHREVYDSCQKSGRDCSTVADGMLILCSTVADGVLILWSSQHRCGRRAHTVQHRCGRCSYCGARVGALDQHSCPVLCQLLY